MSTVTQPSLTATGAGIQVRDAIASDNAALIALTAACTMHGDIALRMDRSPDFFALARLEGDRVRVGVATDARGIVGCVTVARRLAFVNGVPRRIAYIGDLKVHPSARGSGVADALSHFARDTAAELCGGEALALCTILGGNAPMERRAHGPRGTPILSKFATLVVQAIPLLWERRERVAGVEVRPATPRDLQPMAAAWHEYAWTRQFADASPVTAEGLASWIDRAPGLSVADYLVARDRAGNVLGFLGVWDQRAFKQMRVVSYSRRLALARRAINVLAPLVGGAPLPGANGELAALGTVHVCAWEPRVLRALLLEAYRRHRGGRHSFMTVAMDARDPLSDATRGLLAQPTLVNAYVTTSGGFADPKVFSRRLLQYEAALV